MRLGNKKLRFCCLEAGLIGFIQETILKPGQILLSNRAGQFLIFDHAECWIHMGRPLRKLEAKTAEIENDSERDIRGMVKFRNVSGSTKSSEGQEFRDALMTLKQTCFRLGRSFWEYLEGWFQGEVVDLAQCVRERYRTPTTAPP